MGVRLGLLIVAVLAALAGVALLLDGPGPAEGATPGSVSQQAPAQAAPLPDMPPAPTREGLVASPAPAERLRVEAPRRAAPVAGLDGDQVVQGTVRDAAGQPLAGAWVAWRPPRFPAKDATWPLYATPCDHAVPVAPAPRELRVLQTDAEGRFALRRQPGQLRIQHPDHTVALLDVAPDAGELAVVLEPGTVLEGVVLGPPPGAVLEVRGGGGWQMGRTRAVSVHRQPLTGGGTFRLTGLAWGRTTVAVLDRTGQPVHALQAKLPRDSETRLEIDLGVGRPLRLELVGTGAADVRSLELLGPGDGDHAVLAQHDGTLWLGSVGWTGPTRVRGLITGLFQREAPLGMLDLHRDVGDYTLEVPGTLLRVHLGFEPRPATARVTLQSLRMAVGHRVTRYGPGAAGFVDFENVPPGRYLVKTHGPGLERHARVVTVPRGRERVPVVLGPDLRTTRVLVLDGSGRPADGHRVGLCLEGQEIASTVSDATGRAVFEHSPPGRAPLTVVPHRKVPPPPDGSRGVTHVPLDPVPVPPHVVAGGELTLVVD